MNSTHVSFSRWFQPQKIELQILEVTETRLKRKLRKFFDIDTFLCFLPFSDIVFKWFDNLKYSFDDIVPIK